MFTRTRHQYGTVALKTREKGESVWEFRFYELDITGKRKRKAITVGTVQQYGTKSAALGSPVVQSTLLRINAGAVTPPTKFGDVLAKFEQEELPQRHSTRAGYLSMIRRHIRPRWADHLIKDVRPMVIEHWLKHLELAPKTKHHIRALMHQVFEAARRWELADTNPIDLVRVKDSSKRQKPPLVITTEQFQQIVDAVPERYRLMVIVAGCLGLRASEIVGLRWEDFDWDGRTVNVCRSVVHGRVDEVKTEYSQDRLPLDEVLVEMIRERSIEAGSPKEGWLFPSPRTGRPYHQEEIQKKYLSAAGKAVGVNGQMGWHTFRHSYRSWLAAVGTELEIQKGLMRHASISTTINIYGRTPDSGKRQAQGKVVQMLLPQKLAAVS